MRELKLGIISKGQTFGDIDASRNRNYLYSLRTLTGEASVYSINAIEFMNHVAACTKLHELKMFTTVQDNKLVNQLGVNLRSTLDGMNLHNKEDRGTKSTEPP